MGKTRKKKAREKLAGRFPPDFFCVFALSQFSGVEYLGAWNRLAVPEIHEKGDEVGFGSFNR